MERPFISYPENTLQLRSQYLKNMLEYGSARPDIVNSQVQVYMRQELADLTEELRYRELTSNPVG